MTIRAVYVLDVTKPHSAWSPEWHDEHEKVRESMEELFGVAPAGANVRLIVGTTWAPWPLGERNLAAYNPTWARLVRNYAIQIEGSPGAVQSWQQALGKLLENIVRAVA